MSHATERDPGERGEAGQSHSGESSIRVGSHRKMSPPMWSLSVGETALYTCGAIIIKLRKIVVFSFFYITGVNFFVLTDQYNSVEWQEGYALGLRPEMPSGSDPLVAKKAYYTFCLSAGILGAQYGVDRPATGFMVILTLCIPG